MTEALLVALLAVTQAVNFYGFRQASKERQRLINACLARTPAEFVALEKATRESKPKGPAAIPPLGL